MTAHVSADFNRISETLRASDRMPVMFIGHGNPLNAIMDNAWARGWMLAGKALPKPQAVLCISAHWMSLGKTLVNVLDAPPTIHDFGAISQRLLEIQYPAPGSPEKAREVAAMLAGHGGKESTEWGLDHGAWSVLKRLWPDADVPVFQMSIDLASPLAGQLEIGMALKPLREKGVLVLGSGNLVHNLPDMRFDGHVYDWALEFDDFARSALASGDFAALARVDRNGALFRKAHPTPDHYMPALYCAGLADADDEIHFFNEGMDLGCTSMRSFIFT